MAWPLVVPPLMAAAIIEWVRAGGVLVTESELDAFDERGFYRYPEDRPMASALGIRSLGRRSLDDNVTLFLGAGTDRDAIRQAVWLESFDPSGTEVLATCGSGEAVATRDRFGAGWVVTLGTLAGLGYSRARHQGLEAFAAGWPRWPGSPRRCASRRTTGRSCSGGPAFRVAPASCSSLPTRLWTASP